MFTKIDIKKFGLYKDFTWHPTKMHPLKPQSATTPQPLLHA